MRGSKGVSEPRAPSVLIAPATARCAKRSRACEQAGAARAPWRPACRSAAPAPPSARAAAARAARAPAPPPRRPPGPPTTASPSPISTSDRCASGARSPEAPTEPARRDHRQRVGLRAAASSASTVSGRTPDAPRASDERLQRQHQTHHRPRQRLAHAGGVAAHRFSCSRYQVVGRDALCRPASRSRC